MSDIPVYVTQPFLPPLDEFIPYLESIWGSKQLTNNGPLHQQLEEQLCEYLGVPEIVLFNNGTSALLAALQALEISGEVITTPFSFVATGSSLIRSGINPVFVDIDPDTLNIDASKIEEAITKDTTAIMPVHCYGTPCDTSAIQQIAERNGLVVIYDAAHAFAVEDSNGSILRHGDLSVVSFHATKVFNTFEGGAVICRDASIKKRINQLKNFGFIDETNICEPSVNGKLSEVHAAFGLLQLKYIDQIISDRKKVDEIYRRNLEGVVGIKLIDKADKIVSNYAYFPILIEESYPIDRDKLYENLKNENIFARKYFSPLISEMSVFNQLKSAEPENLKIATDVANRVLCLPFYPELDEITQLEIIKLIQR